MSNANPYVAPVDRSLGATWAAGSAELSDVKLLYTDAVDDHDALAATFDAGTAALDVLGDIGDPLHVAIGCAVGWIIDHISFLREPVDWLAGDPESIKAAVSTWTDVGRGMQSDADRLASALASLTGDDWSGAAADAYRAKAAGWVDALRGSASMADLESVLIAATGGLCAGVRALIFEAISDAVEQWVLVGLVALANSAWTFGASIAAWVIDVEIDAGLLAARISAKLADLVERLGRVAETIGRDGGRLEQAGRKITELADHMGHDVRSARSLLGWDRRYSRAVRPGHAQDDVEHLLASLDKARLHLHTGLAHAVVGEGRDIGAVAEHPDTPHVSKLAGDATSSAVGGVQDAVTHRDEDGAGR